MIVLEANYAKKLGLPGYSSHQYSISIRAELTDLSQVEEESERLYQLLQGSVDKEIQHVGFIPNGNDYGMNGTSNGSAHAPTNNNGRTYQLNGNGAQQANGSNGYHQPQANGDNWNCTEGQCGFILRLISDKKLDKQDVEDLSLQLFNVGVKQCNKMQASQLIEEMLAKNGKSRPNRWQRQPARMNA